MAEFTCEDCRRTFEKGWSDEESAAESQKIFGDIPDEDAAIICDDCFKRMMANFS